MMNRSLLGRLERLEKQSGIDRHPTINLEFYNLETDSTRTWLANANGRENGGGPTLRMLIGDAVDGRPISSAALAGDESECKEAV